MGLNYVESPDFSDMNPPTDVGTFHVGSNLISGQVTSVSDTDIDIFKGTIDSRTYVKEINVVYFDYNPDSPNVGPGFLSISAGSTYDPGIDLPGPYPGPTASILSGILVEDNPQSAQNPFAATPALKLPDPILRRSGFIKPGSGYAAGIEPGELTFVVRESERVNVDWQLEVIVAEFDKVGTSRKDFLLGSRRDDAIFGDSGNDKLFGRKGNDDLFGGDDNDRLYGGLDHDELNGGSGHDVLVGGLGNDALFGGDGEDKMYGGPGADTFIGGNETDIFVLTRNSFHIIDYFADFNPGVDKIGLLSGRGALTPAHIDLVTSPASANPNDEPVFTNFIDNTTGDVLATAPGEFGKIDVTFVPGCCSC